MERLHPCVPTRSQPLLEKFCDNNTQIIFLHPDENNTFALHVGQELRDKGVPVAIVSHDQNGWNVEQVPQK